MHVKRSSMLPENSLSLAELSAMSTPELVALAQAGNRQAVDPLYRRFARSVQANAFSRTDGNQALGEDVAAEVWATALAKLSRGFGPHVPTDDGFLRWMFGMTRWVARDIRRVRVNEPPVEPDPRGWEATGTPLYQVPDQDTATGVKADRLDRLHAALAGLSPRQQLVAQLRIEGLSPSDIVIKTGLTAQQARTAWINARHVLRRAVGDRIEDMYRADPARVEAAVALLPVIQRQVMTLRLSGLGHYPIAYRLGLELPTIISHWRSAEQGLRRRLGEPTRHGLTQGQEATAVREAQAMRAGLDRLSPGQRQVAQLRLDGMTFRQISTVTGASPAAACLRWRCARIRLGLAA